MMIPLFPQCRSVWLGGEAVLFMLAAARLYDKAPLLQAALLFAVGSLILIFALNAWAVLLHHRLLLVLVSLQKPEAFIAAYEPLLAVKGVARHIRFTLHAYLSNGYAAKGDFDRALALLDQAPAIRGRQAVKQRVILCVNRCCIALAREDAARAERLLGELPDLLAQLRPADRQAQAQIHAQMTAQLAVLRAEADAQTCDVLREQIKRTGSNLRRTELSFSLAQAYLHLNQRQLAKPYLQQACAPGQDLFISRKALALRHTLSKDA